MASLKGLRQQVYDSIDNARPMLGLAFTLEQAPFPPRVKMEEITAQTRVVIVGMSLADEEKVSRANFATRQQTLQIVTQKKLLADANGEYPVAEGDTLNEFVESMLPYVRVSGQGHNWLRTIAIRDVQGLPFNFNRFREDGIFESIFNAEYTIVSPGVGV